MLDCGLVANVIDMIYMTLFVFKKFVKWNECFSAHISLDLKKTYGFAVRINQMFSSLTNPRISHSPGSRPVLIN